MKNIFLKIQKLKFSFRFDPNKIIPNDIDSHLDIGKVNNKINKILNIYKNNKNVYKLDGNFYLKNIKFYKNYEKKELPLILEILAFMCSKNVINKENFENKSRSYKLDELTEADNLGPNIPKSPYPIFDSFRTIMNNEVNSNSGFENRLQLEDYAKIFKSLKNIPNCHRNFFFILSDYLKLFLYKILTESSSKTIFMDNLDFLNSNSENFKILISLPYSRNVIGNFINKFLLNEINSYNENSSNIDKSSKRLKLSQNFLDFMNSFSYNYDIEVYFNFVLSNTGNKTINSKKSEHNLNVEENSSNLDENTFNTTLSFLFKLIHNHKENSFTSRNNLKQISISNYQNLDQHLEKIVKKILANKNLCQIEKLEYIEKILNIFLNSEKLNTKEILLLPNFINQINFILMEYNKKNYKNEIFFEYFNPIKNFMYFYFKYYSELKQYLYTDIKEHKFLHDIFNDYNTITKTFFEVLKFHDLNKIQSFEYEEITALVNPLQSAFFSNIKSDIYENFCLKFFANKKDDSILEKISLEKGEKHKILHKIILCILNIDMNSNFPLINSQLNFYIEKYLNCFNSEISQDQINFYFINLCTILYNYLLNLSEQFNNSENIILIKRMFIMLINLIKYFSISESKFLRRIILIIENLKISFNGEIYLDKELKPKFIELENIFKQFYKYQIYNGDNLIRRDIWWAKDYFYMNKYDFSEFENILLEKGINVKAFPDLNNCYYSDFSVNKNLYFEFLGSYHLNHYLNNSYDFSKLNNKYLRKKEIYKMHRKDLFYIPYEKVLNEGSQILCNIVNGVISEKN